MKYTPKGGQIKFNFGGAFFMSKYSNEFKLKLVLEYEQTQQSAKSVETKTFLARK